MRTAMFDYELDEELIALRPAEPRESARLMHLVPTSSAARLEFAQIDDLPSFFDERDLLVMNDARVLPAFLRAVRHRDASGSTAGVTINLMEPVGDKWLVLARPAKRLQVGDFMEFAGDGRASTKLSARVVSKLDGGLVEIEFNKTGPEFMRALDDVGQSPLPPYITSRRDVDIRDRHDYQTTFARSDGAVAAPTAGLHLTHSIRERLVARGASLETVTLLVGGGTFLPVKTEDVADHQMHREMVSISAAAAVTINRHRAAGGRVTAVGTTSLRLLESLAREDGTMTETKCETDLFITPGFEFKVVDRLITNFHMPRTTLVMLVAAFCGLEAISEGYRAAQQRRMRFLSYGDACLLERMPRMK